MRTRGEAILVQGEEARAPGSASVAVLRPEPERLGPESLGGHPPQRFPDRPLGIPELLAHALEPFLAHELTSLFRRDAEQVGQHVHNLAPGTFSTSGTALLEAMEFRIGQICRTKPFPPMPAHVRPAEHRRPGALYK